MKISIIISLIVFVTNLSVANDSKFSKVMKKTLLEMKEAKTIDQKQQVVNKLERIANAESKEWLPLYYIAYSYINISAQQKESNLKDQYLDKAQSFLDKAQKLKKDHSEIIALQGYLYIRRLMVDPATRGQQYSGLAVQTLQKAQKIDPENPRAIFLQASLLHGTAQFFGQDPTQYCEMVDLSIQKFEAYKTKSDIYPKWGMNAAKGFKERSCNSK